MRTGGYFHSGDFFWLFVLKVGEVWRFRFNYTSKSPSLLEKKEKNTQLVRPSLSLPLGNDFDFGNKAILHYKSFLFPAKGPSFLDSMWFSRITLSAQKRTLRVKGRDADVQIKPLSLKWFGDEKPRRRYHGHHG